MMHEDDPRIKDLQNFAWSLQSLTNKPGCRLPEEYKRSAYQVTSEALSLCSNAVYTQEADFLERAEVLRRAIEAKRAEVQETEEVETQRLASKCYRPTSDGNYSVAEKVTGRSQSAAAGDGHADELSMTTSANSAKQQLSAESVVVLCANGAETLELASRGLTDADMDALLEGLRNAGSGLTVLDLSSNCLADAGVQRLVSALATGLCPRLGELRLGGNCFGVLGQEMLEGGLRTLRRGLELHLEVSVEEAGSGRLKKGSAGCQREVEEEKEKTERQVCTLSQPPTAGIGMAEESSSDRVEPNLAATAAAGGCSTPLSVEVIERVVGEAVGHIRATFPVLEDSTFAVKDIDVAIQQQRLVVRLPGAGKPLVDAQLPCPVDPDSAKASFSRKRGVVTIMMEVAC